MDNNPNLYNFPDSQNQSSNIPPPPPSMDSQVGVRSMQSDLESVKQSGGEAPQSQIINTPELSAMGQQPPTVQNYSAQETPAQPTTPSQSESMPPFSQASYQPSDSQPASSPKPGLNLKTILFIILGLVVAGGIGYGAYYLVSGLSSTPQISIPSTTQSSTTASLPALAPPVTPTSTPTTTPTTTPISVAPVIPPLVHQSLILKPTKSQTLVINPVDLPDFQSAVASSSKEKLLASSVKDLAFVDASSTPIESAQFLKSYFPGEAQMLSQIFDRDFTSWLYYDKTGGAKFGTVLKLKNSVSLDQASSSFSSTIEGAYSDVKNIFVSGPAVPSKVDFKGGIINGVSVRYLVYNLKSADVFEYAWMNAGGNNYLVMATSYNQMVDIIKRLKALPVASTQPVNALTTPTTTSTTAPTTTPIAPPPPIAPITSTTTNTTTINP